MALHFGKNHAKTFTSITSGQIMNGHVEMCHPSCQNKKQHQIWERSNEKFTPSKRGLQKTKE